MGDQDLELSELEEEAQVEGSDLGNDGDEVVETDVPDFPRSS